MFIFILPKKIKEDNLVLKKPLDAAEAQRREMESWISEQEMEIDDLHSSLDRAQIDVVDWYKASSECVKDINDYGAKKWLPLSLWLKNRWLSNIYPLIPLTRIDFCYNVEINKK